MKKLIIYLSSIVILFNSIFLFSLNVSASDTVPSEYIARAHGTTFSSLQWTYQNLNKYFIIDNPEGIEPSILTSPQYFYTADNVTFFKVNGIDLIQLILTRGLNIIYQPEKASAFILAFFNSIKLSLEVQGVYIKGGVYDAERNFLGYALNDITGCYYEGIDLPENTPAIDIPSYQVNNIKNFYDYYSKNDYPDYINIVCPSDSIIENNIQNENYKIFFQNAKEGNKNLFSLPFQITNNSIVSVNYTGINPSFIIPSQEAIFISTDNSSYQNICQIFDLSKEDNNLLFTEVVLNFSNIGGNALKYNTYNSSNEIVNNTKINYSTQGNPTTTSTNEVISTGYKSSGSGYRLYYPYGTDITVYKNYATYQSINIDKDYEPQGFTGSNYYNYDINNDNSISTTITQIDNSTTTNSAIYDIINDDYYNNVENNNVNNESITNITNTTINNYYPTQTNPDNPSVPDKPIEDDTILNAILAALKRFFDAIGKILGTVLAGLLEVIDSVLEAIAGIMDNLSGFTEFITALFSWLPSPVPQILAAGISICILAAIFKFIRG